MMSCRWVFAVVAAASVSHAALVLAQQAAPALPAATPDEVTPALEAATAKGLSWLAAQQNADGAFGNDSNYGPHVGITGMAGMAFMSDGHLPGRGRYGPAVERCVHFILANRSETGLLAAQTSHGPMYGHGFATLFLAEVCGSSRDPQVHEALRRAVRLIVATQNDEGGWRYQPVRKDADISVTICQIMALRAARNAGIFVEKDTIDRAVQYVKNCQEADGGFRYMINMSGSAFPRSGAGVAALQYAGIYSGPEIERGLAYLMKHLPPQREPEAHYIYGHYYTAQAMFLAGDVYWRTWWPAIRDELLARQNEDGSWEDEAGKEYSTAMALIILQMPNRVLPIFQR